MVFKAFNIWLIVLATGLITLACFANVIQVLGDSPRPHRDFFRPEAVLVSSGALGLATMAWCLMTWRKSVVAPLAGIATIALMCVFAGLATAAPSLFVVPEFAGTQFVRLKQLIVWLLAFSGLTVWTWALVRQ